MIDDDEHEDFRSGRKCVDEVFTLKQKGEKTRQKNKGCMGFMDL